MWRGVYSFYNYENETAIQILTKARLDYPENPAVHLTWAAARWLHNQANKSIDESYRVLDQDLDEILIVYETLVSKYPNDPDYRLFQGSATGLKARIHLGKKEWISTLVAAYKGFDIVTDVAEEFPEMQDAQLPIGLVEYYAGLSSFIVKWAVSLYGFETTRTAGLEKIEEAALDGEWSWIEATSIVTFLTLWVDVDIQKAGQYSTRLVKDFPNNFYFNTMYVEYLIRSGNLEAAEKKLDQMENQLKSLTDIQQLWYTSFWYYEKALLAFSRDDLNTALDYVTESIHTYHAELDMILTNAYLLQGRIYDLQSKRKDALNAYHNCIDRDNYMATIDRAKEYIENPFKGQE